MLLYLLVLPTVSGTTAGGLTLVFNRSSDSVSETTLVVEWGSVLSGFANTLTIGTTDVGPSGNHPTIDIDAFERESECVHLHMTGCAIRIGAMLLHECTT